MDLFQLAALIVVWVGANSMAVRTGSRGRDEEFSSKDWCAGVNGAKERLV